jgi:hypothetical protein
MFGWITKSTMNHWTFIASMVTAVLVVAGSIIGVIKWGISQWRLYHLFNAYYELADHTVVYILKLNPSKIDYIRIALKMNVGTNIDTIKLILKGNGQAPNLTGISDGDLGGQNPGWEGYKGKDGSQILNIKNQPHFNRGEIIRIHVSCKTSTSFNGNLKILITCAEGQKKSVLLPLKVESDNAKTN